MKFRRHLHIFVVSGLAGPIFKLFKIKNIYIVVKEMKNPSTNFIHPSTNMSQSNQLVSICHKFYNV